MRYNLILTSVIAILLLMNLVSAVNWTPTNTTDVATTYTTTTSDTRAFGYLIYTQKAGLNLTQVCKDTTSTGTRALLKYENGTIINTSSISSNCASFNVALANATYYRVEVDANGGSYNFRQKGSASYPIAGTNINYATGSYISAGNPANDSTTYFTIANITTSSVEGIIILNSPASGSIISTALVTTNATAQIYTASTLVNMTLYDNSTGSWAARNTTTKTGTTNTSTFTNTYSDGSNILWNVRACDSDSACGFSGANNTFLIDATAPLLTLNYPTAIINYGKLGSSLQLNYTATDSNLDKCWYNYNGTNSSLVSCSTGVPNLANITLTSQKNITLYANDTAGNLNSSFSSWDYYVFETGSTYSTSVAEGTSTNFTANLTMTSGYRLSSVALIYNGTSSAGTATELSTDNWIVSASKIAPSVSADTNISFYWSLTFEDNSNINTTSNNQTILNIAIDNCGTYTNQLFNFTLVDEDSQLVLVNASGNQTLISVDMLFKNPTTEETVINYSRLYSQVNPARICSSASIGGSTYRVDAVISYGSLNRFTEFYNIDNFILNTSSTNQNITLYDLSNSTGQTYKITYKNSNFNTVPGATIQIQRKYISEGVFKTVELPMVGSDGYAISHLITNDAIYNMLVYQNGVLLSTFSNIIPSCQNPSFTECTININSFASTIRPVDFSIDDDFISSISWNKTSRVVSAIFSVPSGAVATVGLNVTLYDGLGNTSVCSDTLISAGGTLSCTVPVGFSNSTISIFLISDGVIKRNVTLSLGSNPRSIFSSNLVLLAIVMMMFFIGIGVSDDPKIMGVMLILGVIVLAAINIITSASWVGAGATILWFVVAVVIILVKGSDR